MQYVAQNAEMKVKIHLLIHEILQGRICNIINFKYLYVVLRFSKTNVVYIEYIAVIYVK